MEHIEEHGSVKRCWKDSTLTIDPEGFKGKYGCMITFDNGTAKTALRYKLNIYHIGKPNDFSHAYKIDREPELYINDTEPEDFLDQLAIAVSQVIYPLEVETSWDGSLTSVLNFEAIVTRWEEKKIALQEYYKGGIVERYFKLTDQTLSSETIFYEKISKDWCLRLYFSTLYGQYSETLSRKQNLSYPIAGKAKPVQYMITQTLDDVTENETNDIFLRVDGVIDDDRCALDIEQGLDIPYYETLYPDTTKLKGTYEGKYILENTTGIVEGFEADFETEFSIPKKVNVKMFLLEKLKEEYTVLVEEDKHKMPPKKGFWARLFNK